MYSTTVLASKTKEDTRIKVYLPHASSTDSIQREMDDFRNEVEKCLCIKTKCKSIYVRIAIYVTIMGIVIERIIHW